jgi:hypothetical protein
MRVIFEECENEDFFEIILRPKEIVGLWKKGIVADFPGGMYGKRNLNVFVRQETDQRRLNEEDDYAISEREKSEKQRGIF